MKMNTRMIPSLPDKDVSFLSALARSPDDRSILDHAKRYANIFGSDVGRKFVGCVQDGHFYERALILALEDHPESAAFATLVIENLSSVYRSEIYSKSDSGACFLASVLLSMHPADREKTLQEMANEMSLFPEDVSLERFMEIARRDAEISSSLRRMMAGMGFPEDLSMVDLPLKGVEE